MRDLKAERKARAERERREHEGIKREMARVMKPRLTNRDPQTGFYEGCRDCDGFGNAVDVDGAPMPCPNGCKFIES